MFRGGWKEDEEEGGEERGVGEGRERENGKTTGRQRARDM